MQVQQATHSIQRAQLVVPMQDVLGLDLAVEQLDEDRSYDATIITEGIYTPGMGNDQRQRIRFTARFLKRLAESGEGEKVDMEHEQGTTDEVGFIRQVRFEEAKDDHKARIKASLIIQAITPRFTDAIGFIEGRLQSDRVPNVSIELTDIIVAEAPPGTDEWDLELIDAKLAGVALVSKGACNDGDGCGIGLCHCHDPVMNFETPTHEWQGLAAAIEQAPDGYALSASYHGITGPGGEGDHRHTFEVHRFRDLESGELLIALWTSIHESEGDPELTHAHDWGTPTETAPELAHTHALPQLPETFFLGHDVATITVLALEGADTKDKEAHMPKQPPSPGPDNGGEDTEKALKHDLEEAQATIATLTSERDALQEQVASYEAAEVQALQEALEKAAPEGTDLKAMLGEEPSKRDLEVALNAFKATGRVGLKATGGRATRAASRDTSAGTAQPNAAHLVAMRERLGLTGDRAVKLPSAMARNNRRNGLDPEEEAQQ